MKSGSAGNAKVYCITNLSKSLNQAVCGALPGLHAFTGCDSVSALAGKGKVSAYKLMCKDKRYQEAFQNLGKTWELTEDTERHLESFLCRLYGGANLCEINARRYKLFCSKKGEIDSNQLPPCRDCLHKHLLRANYQAAVWRRCLEAKPTIPSPDGHGWTVTSSSTGYSVTIDWMDGLPAPSAVLELLSCQCKKVCSSGCPCVENQLKCTDMCRVKNCTNSYVDDDAEDFAETVDFVGDLYSDEEEEPSDDDEDPCLQEPTLCPDAVEELEITSDSHSIAAAIPASSSTTGKWQHCHNFLNSLIVMTKSVRFLSVDCWKQVHWFITQLH